MSRTTDMHGWRIDEETSAKGNITVKDAKGCTVARVPFDNQNNDKPNDLARARMIVAAPAMLEALELAQATVERLVRHAPGSATGTLDVVRNAIALARRG
jgi:hypothetical protein